MNEFEHLLQLYQDYSLTWAAFKNSRSVAEEVISCVSDRLDREREDISIKAGNMSDIISDKERSETVRRMAQSELNRLEQHSFSVTLEEAEAFDEAVANAETALSDLRNLRDSIKKAIDDVKNCIEQIRADTVGNQCVSMAPNWIAGDKKRFEALYK